MNTETVSVDQLENRLQLVKLIRQQLLERHAVCRHDMQVAVESVGLELPPETPLNSFTRAPSQTNFTVAISFIQTEEQELIAKISKAQKRELSQLLVQIVSSMTRYELPYEPRWELLKVLAQYPIGYAIPENIQDAHGREQLTAIEQTMKEWGDQRQLGQDLLENHTLYQEALALVDPTCRVIADGLRISNYDDETAYHTVVENFAARARHAEVLEQENIWTPYILVDHTVNFMRSFDGPLAYKFQPHIHAIQDLLRTVDDIADSLTLYNLIRTASVVRNYLNWCWKLEMARSKAVECSISICRAVGDLRVLDTTA